MSFMEKNTSKETGTECVFQNNKWLLYLVMSTVKQCIERKNSSKFYYIIKLKSTEI